MQYAILYAVKMNNSGIVHNAHHYTRAKLNFFLFNRYFLIFIYSQMSACPEIIFYIIIVINQ